MEISVSVRLVLRSVVLWLTASVLASAACATDIEGSGSTFVHPSC